MMLLLMVWRGLETFCALCRSNRDERARERGRDREREIERVGDAGTVGGWWLVVGSWDLGV